MKKRYYHCKSSAK